MSPQPLVSTFLHCLVCTKYLEVVGGEGGERGRELSMTFLFEVSIIISLGPTKA